MQFKAISKMNRDMASGMRNNSRTPLTEDEINFIKNEIRTIDADVNKFVFNDPDHISKSTCYDFGDDVVYVTRNVFPDDKYGSVHPRDLMSIRAVLAHEYYGHRPYRQEYLDDWEKGHNYRTTISWVDECRASITAAKTCPHLSSQEQSHLIYDAVYRAKEAGSLLELDDFMKEVLYGYPRKEKNIVGELTPIRFVRDPDYVSYTRRKNTCEYSTGGNRENWHDNRDLPEMSDIPEELDEYER